MDSRPEVLRSTQTPLKRGTDQKTPLRTPLRTPLSAVSEQTSSTPITPFEAIESQKENVQPRSRGRSAHALSHTLSMHHKERQEVLATQRQEWEERVLGPENQDSDDPLEAWCAYVKWCIDNYPDGKSSDSGIVPLLERATREFRSSEQYQNDSRYLRLWILYAQHTDVPRDVFHFLMANEIGTKLASLYEELAHVLESYEMYDEADEMYRLGMARRASPLDRLKRRYHEYQKRILEMPTSTNDGAPMTYAKALAAAMARAGRSVLGVKTGRGAESVPTNVLGSHQPLSSAAVRPNARTMHVYCDNDENGVAPASGGSWASVGTSAERHKENASGRRGLQPLGVQTPRTQTRALEVFCDSDEDASPRRTPRPDDVFQRHARSESDKLRQNPFMHYDQDALRPAPTEPARPRTKKHAPSKPVHERHVVPLDAMYPDADLTAAVRDKAQPIPPTRELCIEELMARRRQMPEASSTDPWSHLDAWHGRWLPELTRRPPSPTLVTKAAMEEVEHMFNGEESSSEEDDSETDDDDVRYPLPAHRMPVHDDENIGLQPKQPQSDRRPLVATPQRVTGGSDEAEEARAPFQPLTPITERTERTDSSRWTLDVPSEDAMPYGGLRAPPTSLAIPNPCSPADPDIVSTLLSNLARPVTQLPGYVDEAHESHYLSTLRARLDARSRRSSVGNGCDVQVADMQLSVYSRLGEGGFGSVFLAQDMNESVPLAGQVTASYADVDQDDIDELERRQMLALKIESPPNPWEFYILDQLRHRLPDQLQASIVGARRFVSCANESLLLLEYASMGTLLELVNHAAEAGVSSVLGQGGGVEEVLAMFFVNELCRIVQGMHEAGLIHGDLKIDNCMIRADDVDEWTSTYAADGSGGWAAKGVTLIDFGRAIDMCCYPPDQRFLADWQPGAQDCVEMREMRPWTYQADYYGLASIAHCLLFGKYMDTTCYVNDDGLKTYKIQQSLRRYWQTDLWTRFFHLMLNSTHYPAVGPQLTELRAEMDAWLTAHSFHAGKNLKGLLKKVEIWALRRV